MGCSWLYCLSVYKTFFTHLFLQFSVWSVWILCKVFKLFLFFKSDQQVQRLFFLYIENWPIEAMCLWKYISSMISDVRRGLAAGRKWIKCLARQVCEHILILKAVILLLFSALIWLGLTETGFCTLHLDYQSFSSDSINLEDCYIQIMCDFFIL